MGPWGIWGIATFEDELACDWLEDLLDSDPIAFLDHCLDLTGLDYLGYLAGIGVICSAEVTHALCNHPRPGLPQAVHDWLWDHRHIDGTRFLPRAVEGMRRVVGPESELRERWEDNEEWTDRWLLQATDLLRRLENERKRYRNAGLPPVDGQRG
jgi:hypothetical protein